MVMVPAFVMLPVRFVFARIPLEPLTPWIAIAPPFLTELLLSMVTAAPLVTLTDPALVISTSPATLVFTGAVTAVPMVVAAIAGEAVKAAIAVEASRKR